MDGSFNDVSRLQVGFSGTLSVAVPATSEDPAESSAKWLLALWQASRKLTWRLWRDRAAISLEYSATAALVRYQVHFARPLLAQVTSPVLRALFPGLDIIESDGSEVGQIPNSTHAALTTFRLRSPGWVDLPKDSAPDGVTSLIAALADLDRGEAALVQLLLEPTWMSTEEGRQPAFWLAGRIAASATTYHAARERGRVLAAAFGQFSGFNGFSFSRVRSMTAADRESILQRRWPHRIIPPEPPATAAQVACLYHPPVRADLFERLHSIGYQRTSARVTNGGLLLGEGTDGRGRRIEVRVSARDLLRHALLLGPSGSGKSTLLAHMALELAREGHGLTVIDPHGSLVRDIARTLPRERYGDAHLLRFSDSEHPISLNPLRARSGQEAIAADELVEIVQRVYGREYWGPLLDLTLRHVAIAAMQLGGSLIEAARLLDDPWFRERALSRLENVETARFLAQLGGTSAYDRRSLPAVHRLQRLLATPWLRNIVGQGGPGLDFGKAFDSRQILLLDLSGLGTTNAKLLGSLILLMIRQTTLGRSAGDGETKPRHFVIVDEASWFVSRTVAELFDQARKFGVGLILAVQRLGQLTPDDVREAVIANSGSLVVFRVSDREEATFFGRHFASQRVGAADLQRLPRYEAYVQLTRDGDREEPSWLRTAAPAPETGGEVVESRLLAAGQQRYARPRAVVERELLQREQSLAEDEEPEVRRLAVPAAAVPAYTTRPAHT